MIYSVSSFKGGVGKSTSTILIGCAMAMKGKRVLLIDLDPQSSTTSYFLSDSPERNIYDVLIGGCSVSSVLQRVKENLSFIPSGISLFKYSDFKGVGKELRLKNAISEIKDNYDAILIDTPPSNSPELINSLVISDYVLSPVEPDLWCVESLDILEEKINEVKEIFNPSLKDMILFQTLYEENRKISFGFYEGLQKKYGNSFLKEMIHRSTPLKKMITFREDPKSSERYFKEYMALTERILSL